jgi:solute:Na+ symporter, SSS family
MVWNTFHVLLASGYLCALLAVGVVLWHKQQDAGQFLNATGSLPLWVCIIASIAANCGSLDVIAMMALGAQYGMLACHFYWIGAIPALIVVAFWLLPAYARGRYPTILDYIAAHYGRRTWLAVSLAMSTMMLLLAGVCLCATANVLMTFFGCSFLQGILIIAPIVLFYTWAGGLRATVYTELIHFGIVLAAVAPLVFLVLHSYGGIGPLLAAIPPERLHMWSDLPLADPHAPMDKLGVFVGLGLILSFGYWSTDFVLMQRALAVKRGADVRWVPLSLAGAKLVFAGLIVLPGVAAPLVLHDTMPAAWNDTLSEMMLHFYNSTWIVVGLMGLAASLFATFANNVSGFSSAWMQGVYRPWICRDGSERHYLIAGRTTNAAAVVLSIGSAYAALQYQSLMEYMQMIFASFNAPIFALVALAVLLPGRVARGGLGGFLLGFLSAVVHKVLVQAEVLHYGSRMSRNFYTAILAFAVTTLATLAIAHLRGSAPAPAEGTAEPMERKIPLRTIAAAAVIVAVTIWFNVYLW